MQFTLTNIPVKIYLGVPDTERATKQTILVSIAFEFQTNKAEKSDDIQDTVDYFTIYQTVQNFPQNKSFKLLESFHHSLHKMLQTQFPTIKNWRLKIEKFPFEDGSIVIHN